MYRPFTIGFLAMTLIGAGCVSSSQSPEVLLPTADTLEPTIYTTFIINVHDWTQPEKSIATLNHILDLHDEYNLPVDIYLDDQVTQIYAEQAPDLIERLKTNEHVAVSYHIRPPTPYYSGFHEEWFKGMDASARYDSLMDYETHAIDLETGKPTHAPGGYQYVKDLIGYAPIVAAQAEGRSVLDQTLAKVYADLGATFTLKHGTSSMLGDAVNGLFLRPENVELKVYERKDAIDADALIEDAIADLPDSRPVFLNLKWHEDNFYTSGTPWNDIYLNADDSPKDPPYDTTNLESSTTPKTETQQQIQWDRYEALLKYVTEHLDTMSAINASDLLTLVER